MAVKLPPSTLTRACQLWSWKPSSQALRTSTALSLLGWNSSTGYFEVSLKVFLSSSDSFNRTGVSRIAFAISSQLPKFPKFFLPYFFIGDVYGHYAGDGSKKASHTGVIAGVVVAVVVILVAVLLAVIYAVRPKKKAKRSAELNPFVNWELNKNSGMAPQLKGARWFSLEELKKCTNNFSEDNTVGSGGYGKVYRAVLPTGELVAIKRAAKESMLGAVEFKTETELLSRSIIRILSVMRVSVSIKVNKCWCMSIFQMAL